MSDIEDNRPIKEQLKELRERVLRVRSPEEILASEENARRQAEARSIILGKLKRALWQGRRAALARGRQKT